MKKEECIKLDDKTLKESIDNLKGTQFLDAFAVLEHIIACKYETINLKQVLNEIKEYINSDKLLKRLIEPKINNKGETHFDLIRKDISKIIERVLE